MKIAHLLPYAVHFPLAKHHGRHEWVLRLASLQSANGHNVTIYASPRSGENMPGISWESSAYDFKNRTLNNFANIKTALQDDSYDIYHSHFDYLHYFLADSTSKPVLFTQHWFPNEAIAQAAHFNASRNTLAVPATRIMLAENQKLGILSTDIIRQGIDLSLFTYDPHTTISDRLVFVGRIAPHKGVLEAVRIAHATHQKLDIIGKINDTDKTYWQEVLPLVDGENIKYLGPKSQTEIAEIFSTAKALLFPSQAPEAAPQVPIEAQACGTPVIISDTGATREWVEHGKSGFVARTEAEYASAINQLSQIERADCRKFAEQFDINKMVQAYDSLYKQLVSVNL